jgi:hypothetical protein
MRIVDTFLFSEPHEKEVLLVKLNLGAQYVAEWVLVENEYTHQSEFKGLFAQEMMDGDPRFDPFRDRLRIISGTHPFPPVDRTQNIDQQGLAADRAQRELALRYLLDAHDDDTWILISDADEALEVSSEKSFDYLRRKVAEYGGSVVPLPRTRYWYDIDNLWLDRRATTMVQLGHIRRHEASLGHYRQEWTMRPIQWPKSVVIEYSYCYGREDIERKYRSFAHAVYSPDEIARSISCNHVPISAMRSSKPDLRSHTSWFKKVKLSRRNTPEYVLRNESVLRTDVVPADYEANRRETYPELFTASNRLRRRYRELRWAMGRSVRGLLGILLLQAVGLS